MGLVLSGCANQRGLDLARQACVHVDRSLVLYRESTVDPTSAAGGTQRSQALAQLRAALPLAASAAGEANQWQGLMATLAESAHLPESDLVKALTQQCDTANSNGVPGQGTTIPGPPTSTAGPDTSSS
ncbi:MAG TPA: hypothetical protein VKU86_11940 [Acidimicrobiales bacterium]|nr:hypothetical protein [Acidimicrobiales bacterium]